MLKADETADSGETGTETEGSAMSQEHAQPPSWRLDSGPGPRPGPVRVGRPDGVLSDLAPAMVLASLPQAFDAFACMVAALVVFPHTVLAGVGGSWALAAGAAVWALAYPVAALARLVTARTAVLGAPARDGANLRFGVARLLLTCATFAIALLPLSGAVAWAPGALIAARLCQGLAIGALSHARLTPLLPTAVERAARLRAGAWAAGLGFAAAGGLMGVLALALQGPDFLAWGWRYPFVISLALNLAALVGDLWIEAERPARTGRPQLRLATISGRRLDAGRA